MLTQREKRWGWGSMRDIKGGRKREGGGQMERQREGWSERDGKKRGLISMRRCLLLWFDGSLQINSNISITQKQVAL